MGRNSSSCPIWTLPRPIKTPPLGRPLTKNKTMLANYQAKVERQILKLPLDLDPAGKLSAIADISVSSCRKAKPQLSLYNSTYYRGGWIPQLLAELADLKAIARMRQHAMGESKRHRWLTPMDFATGIKEIADEWEKKLTKIP